MLKTEETSSTWSRTPTIKPTANIILNDEKLKTFPVRSEQGKDVPSPPSIPFQHYSRSSTKEIFLKRGEKA